jgi:hypothetical protein
MKNVFFLIVLFFVTTFSFAQTQVWVNGYYRSNGTYVQGHYRTAPDQKFHNNWSTIGNVNPHTGKPGYKKPYSNYSTTSSQTQTNSTLNTSYTTPAYKTPTYTTPVYRIPTYTAPSYNTGTYISPSYTSPSYNTRTIYTGPRGGTYYINSNGNKTYVR